MNQIDFQSSKIVSFWGAWRSCLASVNRNQNDFCEQFPEELKALYETLPHFKKDEQHSGEVIFSTLKEINKGLVNGKIKDTDEIATALLPILDNQQKQTVSENLKKAWNGYTRFYDSNEKLIEQNKKSVQEYFGSENISKRIGSLYTFFDASPENVQLKCFLHPYPQKSMIDGWNDSFANHQCFSLVKDEPDSAYIPNTMIKKRKSLTPIHEATHMLFQHSPLMEQIKNNSDPNIKKFMDTLSGYFKDHPKDKDSHYQQTPLNALHEAFACISTRSLLDKENTQSNENTLVFHFAAADRLAHHLLPIMEEYLANEKKADTDFFKRVIQNPDFQKDFMSEKVPDNKTKSLVGKALEAKKTANETKSLSNKAKQTLTAVEIARQKYGKSN